jgi:hypothetical protein
MVASSLSNRWAVVARLQSSLSRFNPGSPRFDTIDHAISLALNPTRDTDSTYLYWDLISDARRIRLRQSRSVFLSALSAPAEDGTAEDWDVESKEATPGQFAEASELAANLRTRLAGHAHTEACLDGMLSGESATDTALRLGIPVSRVGYLRKKVRIAAEALLRGGSNHVAA